MPKSSPEKPLPSSSSFLVLLSLPAMMRSKQLLDLAVRLLPQKHNKVIFGQAISG